MSGPFSDIHQEDTFGFLGEGQPTGVSGVTQELLTFLLVHTQPPANHQASVLPVVSVSGGQSRALLSPDGGLLVCPQAC